jgi:hypothetical protein
LFVWKSLGQLIVVRTFCVQTFCFLIHFWSLSLFGKVDPCFLKASRPRELVLAIDDNTLLPWLTCVLQKLW